MATKETKETIYVDVDDEITNIIDKVKQSDKKIVALVLPKRATVLQSVVNMKLLKKAAIQGKKNIVLITSEAGLLPLAGVAGLHVAKSLQSKPVIPPPPAHPGEDESEVIESADKEDVVDEPKLDKAASIGVLAAAAAGKSDDTETIEIDNSPASNTTNSSKPKKLKHLKVPNFEKFRLGFFLAGLGLVLLIVGWYLAFIVMPRAQVVIKTDTTTAVSSFDFTASTNQAEADIDNKKIPASMVEVKKTDTEKATATGQKDLGTKSTGTVTLSIPCADVSGSAPTVPAGSIVTSGGLNFITDDSATLNTPAFSPCRFTKNVDVTATQNGDNYNLGSGKTFTVSGYSKITGSNGAGFDGGTTKMAKVISQKDIDDAVARIKTRIDTQAEDELKSMIETDNLFALEETRKEAEPKTTSEPAVDKEATEATVTYEVKYTMLGVKEEHLQEIIKQDVEDSIDLSKQAITDYGLNEAIMRINNQTTPAEAFISFRTSIVAGPEIDEVAVKENIRGKKRGEAEKYIEALPGVEEVVVEYSPFWVYSTPKAASKITIVVEKPESDQQAPDTSANGAD